MASESAPAVPAETAEFGFWVGEWDVSWGEDGRGTNTITAILDGFVIQEPGIQTIEKGKTLLK